MPMYLRHQTYRQQSKLAEYCRTGILHEDLDVKRDRVNHYRRLVLNVVNDSLVSAFPITLNLLTKEEWDALVIAFFSKHKPQSAQIWKLPLEFANFVNDEDLPEKKSYPFLIDLLKFEWMEVEVFMMEDIPYPEYQKKGDFMHDRILLNPEHRMMGLSYPVHLKKSNDISDKDEGEYFVLLYREKDSGRVQFVDISAFFAIVIENIQNGNILAHILEVLAEQMVNASVDTLKEHALAFLKKMKEKEFVLGFST